jgi:adenosyl cobinamide kinase/adenosyl cobinamide phosphate guanylyltransferase
MPLVLLIGGARSGKSELALRLAREQTAPVVFLATGAAGDDEMTARIDQHRRERPPTWQTIEEPLQLRETLETIDEKSCVIVDCLTLWAANALERLGAADAETHAGAAAATAAARSGLTIVVSNEVGLGLVPDNPLGRSYRDLLGRVNTLWANAAERTYLLVAGRPLPLMRTDALEEFLP